MNDDLKLTVLGDLACIEHEIATNPQLAGMEWPDAFRDDLSYNLTLVFWVAEEPAYNIPARVIAAARRLEWLCRVLTREEIALLLEAA